MNTAVVAANRAALTAAAPAAFRFRRALRRPEEAQRRVLRRIVLANRATALGRAHGFGRIETVDEYRRAVPPRDYDELAPLVERVRAGEAGVLTAEQVRFLEPSGGSSGLAKVVPYTSSLLREFAAGTLPWLFDLLARRPALRDGRAYWVVSPPGERPASAPGGPPVGAARDADYFPRALRPLLTAVTVAPVAAAAAPDAERWRLTTLRALLAAGDLAFVSVWSPSFLTLLAETLDEHWRPLAAAEPRLRRFGSRAPNDLGELWPRLALVSCWADGHAARALAGLRRRLPRVEVQPKGLLATEGVVSIPLLGREAPVAAVASHFLELLPAGGGQAVLLHEAEQGRCYEPLLTTGGGLYRYRLRDLVRVEGFLERTPLLRFVGRADGASDLAGEKLTPGLVEDALARASARAGVELRFALLAPVVSPGTRPHYVLHAEPARRGADLASLAAALEAELAAAHQYALCRRLGQLGAVRARGVDDAERLWEQVCVERGQRAGTIKPPVLDAALDWADRFARAEEAAA